MKSFDANVEDFVFGLCDDLKPFLWWVITVLSVY